METNEFIVTNGDDFEYWCKGCRQLRLWCRGDEPFECGNCGGTDVVRGKPGELDREELERTHDAD